ncbi:N-acetylmuramoyl-L-alanine amidase [Nostoc spongiaeforme FACHB-130]|uniref:N-acetylmuramoyl-L-alanine amidase n=1 Tax=Nostoc spongiaeforme FACHB-130 TaxID=1357510 RepID=A0ABR8FQ70_9NOSO|nr:N-acetylmuramoyl-L-alanine amidase [Nostoc spongiaeforme]MBD2593466.1 N-acetylmuramoyl-L-alanine amidase [Nostoc spongiaeforme FACHB-130]
MKLHWLLPGTVGMICLLSSPVLAARLESWRFDAKQNRLEFNTSGGVQPKAQLIFNPTRLVIDLPDTTFGRPQLTQPVGGAVRAIRVGQFEPQTARIVVELAPGYTLDPQGIKFVGITPSRWTVQLPRPRLEPVNSSADNVYNVVTSLDSDARPPLPRVSSTTQSSTQIDSLQVTGDGFFVRTSGGNPQIRVNRSRDRSTIFMDISNATLSTNLAQRDLSVNKHGVSRVEFTQLQTSPPAVRMTLRVDKNSPDWRAARSGATGLIVLPNRFARLPGNNSNNSSDNQPELSVPSRRIVSDQPATIEAVELSDDNKQLLIRADQTITARGGWDRTSGLYRITINDAKLAHRIKGPTLNANSPILRVRLQTPDSNTVVILVQPAAGIQFGQINQNNDEVALQLQGERRVVTVPGTLPFPSERGQLPDPNENSTSRPPVNTRPIPKGRVVVVIDPGHGGKDPGAIGIGGIREKDIILPISKRVAEILQQNGVQVIMTRNSDYFVTLPGRVQLAERANADVFVSIHANSAGAGRPDVSGLETYYYDSGLGLARAVHNSIRQSVNVRDRGVRRARFFVLRKSSMPSILVETGYLTGREDIAKLRTSAYQNQMAEAIARGVLQYLKRR